VCARGKDGRAHRFAADPQCWATSRECAWAARASAPSYLTIDTNGSGAGSNLRLRSGAMQSRGPGRLLWIPLTLSLAGPSCGGGSSPASSTPSPTPSPTAPQPVVVDQAGGTICWGCSRYRSVATTRAGDIRVELNWTYATNWLTVGIAASPCDYSQECTWLVVSSWPQTPVPSRTLVLANAAAGTYVVVVHSIGPGEESYSYQVTLTPTT
jgi:hypothetical protein